jgi:3alpha(or 20beta)-hydroxysteroid dehydrogenase
MMAVAGKIVIVTGAARGQGAEESLALARAGATVIAADILPEPTALAAAASTGPGTVHYRQLDVSRQEEWAALAQWIGERFGRVDGLVNNAGIAVRDRLPEVTLADWERVLSVNLSGALLGMQAVLPLMGRGGSIVNVGSVAALSAHYPVAYTVSKWGLRGLSRVASMELGPRGIRVNSIHPGFIDTPMTAAAPRRSGSRTCCRSRWGGPGPRLTSPHWSYSSSPMSHRLSAAPRFPWTAVKRRMSEPCQYPRPSAPSWPERKEHRSCGNLAAGSRW